MRKIILKNHYAPGDIVMLTAAVRDLHRHYPGRFLTDVRTPCPDLWVHNPHLTPLREDDPEVTVLDCDYPLINRSDRAPYHCLHGFIHFLNEQLGLRIEPSEFKGDIHLSPREKSWFSQVHELTGEDTPFWILAAGGKYDVTIKWWDTARYQAVVDHFRDRILFVQVGNPGHHHPRLKGVLDLRGQTTLRQLVRLVHHAQGVLCPVTLVMHLAAAVETRAGRAAHRPCVVIAGGREPPHWEAYPGHQFLHTLGMLPCCAEEGCWRARTEPLGDGDERDAPDRLCVNVVGGLPRCMDMITPANVIRPIEMYFEGGMAEYLRPSQLRAADRGRKATARNSFDEGRLSPQNVRRELHTFLSGPGTEPCVGEGRGIVICAGGVELFTCAWVTVRLLRRLGCRLPIQLWCLDDGEMSGSMRGLIAEWAVEIVSAAQVKARRPTRIRGGWELKAFALGNTRFREVLLLDADNAPLRNPEFLFDSAPFLETGWVAWPDEPWAGIRPEIETLCAVLRPGQRPLESGQLLVDRQRMGTVVRLAEWFNEHSDFFYQYMHGDKGTFLLALEKLNVSWAMPVTPMRRVDGVMIQHDFEGAPLFHHRSGAKWTLFPWNTRVPEFEHEEFCLESIQELRELWDGRISEVRGGRDSPPFARLDDSPGRRTIAAVLMSFPEREELRKQTLTDLADTDWPADRLSVAIETRSATNDPARLGRVLRTALTCGLKQESEFILLLADDLRFNRWIRSNLEAWAPLVSGEVGLATLEPPTAPLFAVDPRRNLAVLNSQARLNGRALLLSRAAAGQVLRSWYDLHSPFPARIMEMATRWGRPVLVHAPALVVPSRIAGSGRAHTFGFERDWRSG